jgi:hypothetical protein
LIHWYGKIWFRHSVWELFGEGLESDIALSEDKINGKICQYVERGEVSWQTNRMKSKRV